MLKVELVAKAAMRSLGGVQQMTDCVQQVLIDEGHRHEVHRSSREPV